MPLTSPIQKHRTVLSCLAVSEKATVIGIPTDPDLQGRLLGLGLFPGREIELQQGSAGQRPLRIAIGNTRIAMSPEIADQIIVEPNESKNI